MPASARSWFPPKAIFSTGKGVRALDSGIFSAIYLACTGPSRKPDRRENVTFGRSRQDAMKTPRFGSMQTA
jgi:hypothetical protein